MSWALLLVLTISSVQCEQWYMPDSSLISDQEFSQKVVADSSRFKFVKYFTPHCPYCRYLKAVFDTLKHRKQWCFSIYELNCQWYPQFCMQNVRSTSFPYTVVYDQRGQIYEEIHGFYPEPIISNIFDRIEQLCLNLRQTNTPTELNIGATAQPATQMTQHQGSLSAEIKQASEKSPQVTQNQQEPQTLQPKLTQKQQTQTPQPRNAQQSEVSAKPIAAEASSAKPEKQGEVNQLSPYISYAFYSICLLVAAIYIRSLHSLSPQIQQTTKTKPLEFKAAERPESEVRGSEKVESQQDSELLEIPDDQL